MASNKKSYDGAHDYKQELKSGYRHSERFETDTCHTELTRVTGVAYRSNLYVEGFESPQLCNTRCCIFITTIKLLTHLVYGKILSY